MFWEASIETRPLAASRVTSLLAAEELAGMLVVGSKFHFQHADRRHSEVNATKAGATLQTKRLLDSSSQANRPGAPWRPGPVSINEIIE
jgi:hypothetical protein